MEPEKDPREVTAALRVGVRELIASRGVDQDYLAAHMGVTKAYVSNVLTGRKQLTLTFIAHACAVLGADLELRPDAPEEWEFYTTPDLGRKAS